MLYKDILNYKLNRNIDVFTNYIDNLSTIALKNDLEKLYKKIELIIDAIDKNNYNVNINLNLDNLLIRMEGYDD